MVISDKKQKGDFMKLFLEDSVAGITDNMEVTPHWLGTLIIAMFVVVVIAIFMFMARDFIMQIFSRKVTATATLISKFKEEYVDKKMYVGNGAVQDGLAEKGIIYYFILELENGKRVTFPVSKDVYDISVEGTEGVLTYKYKTMISFDARTEGTRIRKDTEVLDKYFVSFQDKL